MAYTNIQAGSVSSDFLNEQETMLVIKKLLSFSYTNGAYLQVTNANDDHTLLLYVVITSNR